MTFWCGQRCGLGRGLSLSVICWAGEIALACARKSFYICLLQCFTRFGLCYLNTTLFYWLHFMLKTEGVYLLSVRGAMNPLELIPILRF